jgi:hypothetical protein
LTEGEEHVRKPGVTGPATLKTLDLKNSGYRRRSIKRVTDILKEAFGAVIVYADGDLVHNRGRPTPRRDASIIPSAFCPDKTFSADVLPPRHSFWVMSGLGFGQKGRP